MKHLLLIGILIFSQTIISNACAQTNEGLTQRMVNCLNLRHGFPAGPHDYALRAQITLVAGLALPCLRPWANHQ
jgi:hypothetical protein